MFNLKTLENKTIGILGLGKENQALLKFLISKKIKANFVICDFREEKALKKILKELQLSPKLFSFKTQFNFNQNLDNCDILFRSPGWSLKCPGIKKAKQKKVEVSSPMNLFFSLCPSKNIIGITGTKGKGTTSSLIFTILKENYKNNDRKVFLGGNIGIAPFEFIKKIKQKDFVILELSSFQLEDLKYSPKIAIITNLYPEHLSPADPNNPNYHHSFKEYVQAKANIFKHQTKQEKLFLKPETKKIFKRELPNIFKNYPGKIIEYQASNLESNLSGEYNKENIGAGKTVTQSLKINLKTIKKAIAKFKPLEHRLELVKNNKGIKYYDNSFATTPESSILDLKSFSSPIILLAGGADKGSEYKEFAKEIKNKVKFLILFQGEGTNKLIKELEKLNFNKNKLQVVDSMKKAVKMAKKYAEKNNIVLLSTGSASFGVFKNYKERGNLFKKYVKEL